MLCFGLALGLLTGAIFVLLRVGLNFVLHIVGALMAFAVLQKLANKVNWQESKVFGFISKLSMPVYLIHQQVVYVVIYFLNGLINPYIHAAVNFIVAMGVSLGLSALLVKFRVTRFMVGEKYIFLGMGTAIMSNSVFQKDLYRYYGEHKETLKERLLRPVELKYIQVFRKAQASSNIISKVYYRLKLRRLAAKSQIQIPAVTQIGAGFYIGHSGRVIINPNAKLGKNVNIATGVTIGQENRGKRAGCPTIGDNVWIGTNAVVIGGITVGSDVLIAPLTFVNFDVPDHSIVVGNPAKIIHRENATEGYINRTV